MDNPEFQLYEKEWKGKHKNIEIIYFNKYIHVDNYCICIITNKNSGANKSKMF